MGKTKRIMSFECFQATCFACWDLANTLVCWCLFLESHSFPGESFKSFVITDAMRKVPQHDMRFLLRPLGYLSIGIFRANLELISTYHLQHVTIPWNFPVLQKSIRMHLKASCLFSVKRELFFFFLNMLWGSEGFMGEVMSYWCNKYMLTCKLPLSSWVSSTSRPRS